MVDISLGRKTSSLSLNLVRGEGFRSVITANVEWTFPLTLVFADRVWTATISGKTATFDIPKAQADGLQQRDRVELRLGDFVWARGVVVFS